MSNLDDLPELPDLPEVEELPELPDDVPHLAEVQEEAVPPGAVPPAPEPRPAPPIEEAPTPAPVATGATGAPLAPGETPPLRELDKAPVHLRLASKIVVVGAFAPFMGPGPGWEFALAGKLVVLAAAWVWLKQVLHDFGPPVPGFLGKLANMHLKPKKKEEDEKKKKPRRSAREQGPASLEHPFPTGLHLLSILLIVAAVLISMQDSRAGFIGPKGVAEMGMLGWAAFTFVHIANYERWGKFNPLFPLMFLAMLFSGLAGVLGSFGTEGGGLAKIAAMAGGAAVALGGGLAAYTIVEAMMHAKREGDRKKQEALEARRAARKTRR